MAKESLISSSHFNLLEENWISVLLKNGQVIQINPIECLEQSASIVSLISPNPMDRMAIFRFLLALLCWCGVHERLNEGKIELVDFGNLRSALVKEARYFNLFGEPPRFFQYPHKAGDESKYLPVNYLIHEVPTGSNVPFFLKALDSRDGLCPACCAKGLLRLPLFTTVGGRGKKPGINGKPPVYRVPLGDNLKETLIYSLNLVRRLNLPLGSPAWRTPLPRIESPQVALLNGLTWLPRVVWLEEPAPSETNEVRKCVNCGSPGPIVTRMIYQGVKWSGDVQWNDPHVVRKEDGRPLVLSDESRPGAFGPTLKSTVAQITQAVLNDKDLIGALGSIPQREQFKVWLVGLASDQNKYIEALEHTITLNKDLLRSPTENSQKISRALKEISRQQAEAVDLVTPERARAVKRKKIGIHAFLTASNAPIRSALERRILEGIAIGRLPGEPMTKVEKNILQSICTSLAPSEVRSFDVATKLRLMSGRKKSNTERG